MCSVIDVCSSIFSCIICLHCVVFCCVISLFYVVLKVQMSCLFINAAWLEYAVVVLLLQCFDAVGWVAGRATGPVKNWVVECWRCFCLELGADLHMAQLMPLPLTVSCFSKIQIGFTFLVPAHPGSLGKRAVKRVCVCVCVLLLLEWWRLFDAMSGGRCDASCVNSGQLNCWGSGPDQCQKRKPSNYQFWWFYCPSYGLVEHYVFDTCIFMHAGGRIVQLACRRRLVFCKKLNSWGYRYHLCLH